jgi:hypothetical protein
MRTRTLAAMVLAIGLSGVGIGVAHAAPLQRADGGYGVRAAGVPPKPVTKPTPRPAPRPCPKTWSACPAT